MSEHYTKEQIDGMGAVIGNRIAARTAPAAVAAAIAAAANANLITDDERAAIANIEPSHFVGTFAALANIPTVDRREGDVAILAVVGGDDTQAVWDVGDGVWRDTGASVTGETSATIKTKYEANPNTNAFTDAYQAQLDGLTEAADISGFTAALDGALA